MNSKRILAYLCTLLLIWGCNQNTKQAASTKLNDNTLITIDDKLWQITVNNGKGTPNANYPIATTTSLMDNYLQNLSIIDSELAYSLSSNNNYKIHFSTDSLSIDSIGIWGDYKVYQISNFYVMHRSIILKYTDGQYRILYTESDYVGSPQKGTLIYGATNGNKPLSKTEIAKELRPAILFQDGKHILDIKYFVGGNSEYYGNYAYEIDNKTHLPTQIKK